MGDTLPTMKLFLLALIATASALPSPDMTVPETELVSAAAYDPAKEAQATVTNLLQSGKDAGACADLASSAIQEVVDAVASQQKVLDSLDTGADCGSKGQSEVDSAQSALDQANKDKEDADAAAASATAADVQFAPKPLSAMKEGECGSFFSDPAYIAAVAAKNAAASGATQAAGAVTAAATGLKTAQDAQKEAIKECQCNAKHAYDKAWEAANTNNDADAKTYTKGKHMKCVLDDTPPADCQVGDIPKVQAITLADGVEQAECGEAPTHTSKKVTCDLTIDNAVTDVQYNGQPVQLTGDMGNWNANKKIPFDTVADGVLLVAGYDSEGGNSGHCKSAGFAIQCQSEDSFWGSFSSASSAIQAAGGQNSHGGFNGPFNAWGKPCTSTSGFSLPANRNAKKLWAPNGERWAKFQMGPSFQ